MSRNRTSQELHTLRQAQVDHAVEIVRDGPHRQTQPLGEALGLRRHKELFAVVS
jgi:hypothetical protein